MGNRHPGIRSRNWGDVESKEETSTLLQRVHVTKDERTPAPTCPSQDRLGRTLPRVRLRCPSVRGVVAHESLDWMDRRVPLGTTFQGRRRGERSVVGCATKWRTLLSQPGHRMGGASRPWHVKSNPVYQ